MKREDALELISKYFDRVIDDRELATLRSWLDESDAHMDLFAAQAIMHTEMHRVINVQDISTIRGSILGPACAASDQSDSHIQRALLTGHEIAPVEPAAPALPKLADRPRPAAQGEPESPRNMISLPGLTIYRSQADGRSSIGITVSRLFAAAVVLLAVTAVSMVIFSQGFGGDRYLTPVVAATLTETNQPQWAEAQAGLEQGDELLQGRYTLDAGFAKIKMKRGATVLLQGPCAFELVDDNTIFLDRGQVVATVPPAAKHFTVRTDAMDLVDIGTQFGVSAGYTRTHVAVFRGVVELHEPGDDEPSTEAPTLTEGWQTTARVNKPIPTRFQLLPLDHDYVRTIRESRSLLEIKGPCRNFRSPPRDASIKRLNTGDHAVIFRERTHVSVDDDLANLLIDSLTNNKNYKGTIDFGARPLPESVDSYLVHAEDTSRPDRWRSVEFSVRFPRRVVGVFSRTSQLTASDAALQHPDVQYPVKGDPQYVWRGFEDDSDTFTISEDGHTVHFHLTYHLVDQVRVVIASEPEAGFEPEPNPEPEIEVSPVPEHEADPELGA